jgi:pimeloyl-ACP methyl ester carboxylesterase
MPDEITHSFIRTNGVRLHVARIEKDGPLVFLLHGFPEFWYSWRKQMPVLARAGFRVWAPDLRGINTSAKPHGIAAYHLNALVLDIVELLDAASVAQAIIAGHDWGAVIAWRLAMDYPERVSRLAILNVPHPAKFLDGFRIPQQWLRSWYIGFFQLPWLPETFITRNARWVARGMRSSAVRKQAFTNEDLEMYAQALLQPGAAHAAINYYRALLRWDFWLPLKPIKVPTLMIWGEEDIALSKRLTYGTEKYVSDFRLHYIPRCGHWVQNEAPDEVNQLLLEFLRETPFAVRPSSIQGTQPV